MEEFLARLEQTLWGWPLLLWILGAGLWLTVRLRCLPLRRMGTALRLLFRREGEDGGISPLAALCTSLSATVGTGNLVGVASALALGGPGALFWMEVSAVTGLALKYAEGLLAVKYRYRSPGGGYSGGPFAYIRLGLGERGRGLARAFACFGALAGICGVGTFVQIGSITAGLRYFLEQSGLPLPGVALFGHRVPLAVAGLGLLLTGLAAPLILGGIRKISRVSTLLVPLMGGLYLLCCFWILIRRAEVLPGVLRDVLRGAFTPAGVTGGLLGTVQAGISRGVFSNEAGLGTAPIAAAEASGVKAGEQGLISMTATLFDTLLICTLTGLAILCTGANRGGAGIWSAMEAFSAGLPLPPMLSRGLVLLCLCLFAFTTAVGWSFYGTACLDFLTGSRLLPKRIYLAVYIITILLAPYLPVRALWSAANICNGLMAIPNITGILLLRRQIVIDSRPIMGYSKGTGGIANGDSVSGRPGPGLPQAGGGALYRRARRTAGAAPDRAGRSGGQPPHSPSAGPGGQRSHGPGPHGPGGLGPVRADPIRRL